MSLFAPLFFNVAPLTSLAAMYLEYMQYLEYLARFVKHPEYLKEGQRLVFREGRTKAVGNVTKVVLLTFTQLLTSDTGHLTPDT